MSLIDPKRLVNFSQLPKPFISNILCSSCGYIINNPIDCNSCNESFCYMCFEDTFRKSKSCPNKCFPCEMINSSKGLKEILKGLEFKCSDLNCKEVLSYSDAINQVIFNKCLHSVKETKTKTTDGLGLSLTELNKELQLNNYNNEKSVNISSNKDITSKIDQLSEDIRIIKKSLFLLTNNLNQSPDKSYKDKEIISDSIISNEDFHKEPNESKTLIKLKNKLNECSVQQRSNKNLIDLKENLSSKIEDLFKQCFDELELISFRLSSNEFHFSEENLSKIFTDVVRKCFNENLLTNANDIGFNNGSNNNLNTFSKSKNNFYRSKTPTMSNKATPNEKRELSNSKVITENERFNTNNQHNQRSIYGQSLRNIKLSSKNPTYKPNTMNNLDSIITSANNIENIEEETQDNRNKPYMKKTAFNTITSSNIHNPNTSRSKSPTITEMKFVNYYESMIRKDSQSSKSLYSILSDFIFISKRYYDHSKDSLHHIKQNTDNILLKGTKDNTLTRNNRFKDDFIDETKTMIQGLIIDQSDFLMNNIKEILLSVK